MYPPLPVPPSLKALLCCLLLAACTPRVTAQDSTFVGPVPAISIADIGLHYYAIRWQDEQWAELRGTTLELAYLIDEIGEPYLRAVHGTEDETVIDSLIRVTGNLPYFRPATYEGARVESAYYLSVPFPDLAWEQARSGSTTIYYPPVTVDREELESQRYRLGPSSLLMDLGFHANSHFGRSNRYLKPGGGMDMYLAFHWKNRWGVGGMLGLELNGKKELFPVDPLPDRELDAAGGSYIGPLVEYALHKTKQRDLALRGEIGLGEIFVSSKIDPPNEEGFIRYRGLHLGAHLNYNIKFGRYATSVSATDRETTGTYHGLNVYAGVRLRRYRYGPANGVYAFVGVGYRLGMNSLQLVAE